MEFSLTKLRIACATCATILLIVGIVLIVVGSSAKRPGTLTLSGILVLTAGLMAVWLAYIIIRGVHAHMMILQHLKEQETPSFSA